MEILVVVAGIAMLAYFLISDLMRIGIYAILPGDAPPPGDTSGATTENFDQRTSLQGGPWTITFVRQSGNIHRIDSAQTAAEAVRKVQAAFRRAGIGLIRLSDNDSTGFIAMRAIYNGRGSSEGKKLGGARVSRAIAATPPPPASPKSRPVSNWTQTRR